MKIIAHRGFIFKRLATGPQRKRTVVHIGNNDGYQHPGLRDAPLSLRFDMKQTWPALRRSIPDLTATGAACAIALWSEAITAGRSVSYSRTADHYAGRETALYTRHRVRGAMEALDAHGLLSDHFRQRAGVRGRQSTARASDDLIKLVTDVLGPKPQLVVTPPSPLVIRDAEGRTMPIPKTEENRRADAKALEINWHMRSADISHGAGACYTRIFNGSTRRGGRFYAQGRSWQNMRKEDRHRLRINGESVVELDYASMHYGMLYAEAGRPLAPGEDPYDVPGVPRKIAKVAGLILINARTARDAHLALTHDDVWLKVGVAPGTKGASERGAAAIAAMIERNGPIRKAFHSDAGAALMRRDSDIAQDVMLRLVRQNITPLCVHDSFIVAASKEGALRDTMKAVAEEHGYPTMGVERAA